MASVRRIIAQSTVDGPGNRTAVFLQGCNIRCAYCHNPETQAMCDEEAREMTVGHVVEEIARSVPFIRGITVSGGECMLQAEWLTELFRAVKELSRQTGHSLSCLIDSNGTVSFEHYPELMQLCDGVMLDVKAWDESVYERLTHARSNSVVKANLLWLLRHDKLTEVRVVCMPAKVDVETILENVAKTFDSVGKKVPVRLLRFRPQGVVGEWADYPQPSNEQMEQFALMAGRLGIEATVR